MFGFPAVLLGEADTLNCRNAETMAILPCQEGKKTITLSWANGILWEKGCHWEELAPFMLLVWGEAQRRCRENASGSLLPWTAQPLCCRALLLGNHQCRGARHKTIHESAAAGPHCNCQNQRECQRRTPVEWFLWQLSQSTFASLEQTRLHVDRQKAAQAARAQRQPCPPWLGWVCNHPPAAA